MSKNGVISSIIPRISELNQKFMGWAEIISSPDILTECSKEIQELTLVSLLAFLKTREDYEEYKAAYLKMISDTHNASVRHEMYGEQFCIDFAHYCMSLTNKEKISYIAYYDELASALKGPYDDAQRKLNISFLELKILQLFICYEMFETEETGLFEEDVLVGNFANFNKLCEN